MMPQKKPLNDPVQLLKANVKRSAGGDSAVLMYAIDMEVRGGSNKSNNSIKTAKVLNKKK